MSKSIKIRFRLQEDELGPYPVRVESLWCELVDGYYKIKNVPMFMLNLAYGDLVDIEEVGDNEFQITEVIETSGNSTVWIQINTERNKIIDKLKSLKCQVESGAFEELCAINISEKVEWEPIGKYLDSLDEKNEIVALYASFNHEEY
ncbi:DUF4265 domain-containing protein [Colwellia psychrerythraea]|uniref:DUF4265 domain-containing protein n=1 Tax=Colwellia psychrerythraea TaxID=28229 RepID=A0A099KTT8_COLPS|nr:DUF4265 domain-containing protein [Colwellia psychrerythraea]KGJ93282.1 Protein of unknown function DUF4265 [Colwellia psychrerythraea]